MKAKVNASNVRISTKGAVKVGRRIKGEYISKARNFLESMISKKADIGGKHHTKTCKELLSLLDTAEKNAIDKDMNEERLVISFFNASEGTHIHRQRWRGVGSRLKMTNVKMVLTQASKPLKVKKKKKPKKKEKVKKGKPGKGQEEEFVQDYDQSIANPKAKARKGKKTEDKKKTKKKKSKSKKKGGKK